MMRSALKTKLRAGEFTLGSWITLAHASVAEMMARTGFDFLVVDLEHSVIDLGAAGELIRVIDLCGAAPLVRLTSNNADQIKRVMDAGAHGIVVPMVNSADDATRAVAATRYPPLGTRGVGLSRAQAFGGPGGFQEYFEWQKDGPVVIAQIEHVDAVNALESILNVSGIDAFIIGPYDLSCSMGLPGDFAAPAFVDAMARIREVGRRVGRPGGLHLVEPETAKLEDAIRDGYDLIAYSVDFRIIDAACRAGIAAAAKLKPRAGQ